MKILKGFVLGVFITIFMMDVSNVVIDNIRFSSKYHDSTKGWKYNSDMWEKNQPILKAISYWLITPTLGLYFPLTKRCIVDTEKRRGRGYFKCNKVQIFVSDLIY